MIQCRCVQSLTTFAVNPPSQGVDAATHKPDGRTPLRLLASHQLQQLTFARFASAVEMAGGTLQPGWATELHPTAKGNARTVLISPEGKRFHSIWFALRHLGLRKVRLDRVHDCSAQDLEDAATVAEAHCLEVLSGTLPGSTSHSDRGILARSTSRGRATLPSRQAAGKAPAGGSKAPRLLGDRSSGRRKRSGSSFVEDGTPSKQRNVRWVRDNSYQNILLFAEGLRASLKATSMCLCCCRMTICDVDVSQHNVRVNDCCRPMAKVGARSRCQAKLSNSRNDR